MAQMSQEEFDRRCWQQIDPRPDQEKKEAARTSKWLLAAVLGLFVGGVFAALSGVPAAFLVGWVLGTVGIGSWLEGEK